MWPALIKLKFDISMADFPHITRLLFTYFIEQQTSICVQTGRSRPHSADQMGTVARAAGKPTRS